MAIVENLKDLISVFQKADNIENYRKILDLQAEVQTLVDENGQLRERIQALEHAAQLGAELIFENNVYWREEDGRSRQGPFCSNCWDIRQNLVRMHRSGNPDYVTCPTCGKPVNVTGRFPRSATPQRGNPWAT